MFLNEYLPNTLVKLFSKYDWIFDWKRVGANKRWIVLIDRELSRYYNESDNELELYKYSDADLEILRDTLRARHKQLTDIGQHINKAMDEYGEQFSLYLQTKLGA